MNILAKRIEIFLILVGTSRTQVMLNIVNIVLIVVNGRVCSLLLEILLWTSEFRGNVRVRHSIFIGQILVEMVLVVVPVPVMVVMSICTSWLIVAHSLNF